MPLPNTRRCAQSLPSCKELDRKEKSGFLDINRGFARTFRVNTLTIGLVVPIQNYARSPRIDIPLRGVQLAESLGFSAVWLRDVPFDVPSFGDPGQIFDPFVQLGALSMATRDIALGVASVILPLRHPAHVAKAAASVDVLSKGRLLLGVASGDRPDEYPAMQFPYHERAQRFRDAVAYIRAMATPYPEMNSPQGRLRGDIDLVPKPYQGAIPLLITGSSRQSPEWVAEHGDGWMIYPRPESSQVRVVSEYRRQLSCQGHANRPVMQSLYVDLVDDPAEPLSPIHLGYRCGTLALREHLRGLREIGINHVALNLRFNRADIPSTLKRISDELFPEFQT